MNDICSETNCKTDNILVMKNKKKYFSINCFTFDKYLVLKLFIT